MSENPKKIVIADDNKELCDILKTILEGEGYKVEVVYEGFSLIAHLKEVQDVDAIILDLMMPEKAGISVINTVRSISPASKLIIYTGFTTYRHSVFGREADAFLNKTEGPEKLIEVLKKLIG
ncbi:MAG: response regulator transcription factor [Candidatus Omnitrophota bacterium]